MLDRPRLHQALEAGLDTPVTLISAAPGYGKTTLLSSWVRRTATDRTVAWLTLESADSGHRFWSYVRAALGAAGVRGSGGRGLPVPGSGSGDSYLTLLADALARTTVPAVLVLDDFQVLTDPDTLGDIVFLVRHASHRLRLVLSTRADPALPLQRWRVHGELSEIRTRDLSFTEQEATELLGGQEHGLTREHIATLHDRTEGWATGLRLATLSLPSTPNRDQFTRQFGGGHGNVAEYLLDEVYAPQTAEVQHVLLCGAVASRVCGELVDALAGGTGGQRILDQLHHENAFLLPLGGRPGWFRFSRLLGDLLFAQLHREASSEQIHELNRRAAAWHASWGSPVLALRHALAGQDYYTAAAVLAAHWHDFTLSGDGDTLRSRPLPPSPDEIRAAPSLALACAADRLDIGDHDSATTYLRLADTLRHRVDKDTQETFSLIVSRFRRTAAQRPGPAPDVMPLAPRHLLEAENAAAVELLSPRELTVVHYLQTQLTNCEIAAELTLSVHTVKTHVQSIYRKLQVTRRREAVRRARDLHLL